MPHGRLRGIAASVVAVAVIALFALLLHSFVPGHGLQRTSTASKTSLEDIHGRWVTLDGLTFTSDIRHEAYQQIAIAPSAPDTVYTVNSSPLTIKRTDDSGATWHTLSTPLNLSQSSDAQIFVSPLDARTVFVTLQTQDSSLLGANCPATPSGGRKSGYIPCSYQFISRDGGSTWAALHLPVQGVLASVNQTFAQPGWSLLKAQGSRLYAAVGLGLSAFGPGYHMVASSDGGTTWSSIDTGLAGQDVCDFAPSPSGSDLFAITANAGCDNEALSTLSLWHSSDAGGTWTHSAELPTPVAENMTVTPGVDAAHPLVYIYMPAAISSQHTVQVQNDQTSLRVTADGGQTWQPAPTQGFPNATGVAVPIGVSSDGAILVAGAAQQSANATSALYAWKAGQTSWRQVTGSLRSPMQYVLVAHDKSGGDIYYTFTAQETTTVVLQPTPASSSSGRSTSSAAPPTPTPGISGPSASSQSATTTFVVQRYLP